METENFIKVYNSIQESKTLGYEICNTSAMKTLMLKENFRTLIERYYIQWSENSES